MDSVDSRFTVDAIVAPLDGGVGTGIDLRRDASPNSFYFRLRDARAKARAAERAAEYEPDACDSGRSAWSEVGKLAVEALTVNTKDLEIAAWLTESLVRRDGLRGLASGAKILAWLIDRFWDAELYPLADEDGFAGRLAPVGGLSGGNTDGTLLQPLRKITLFERNDGSPLTVWQFERSEAVVNAPAPVKPGKPRASNVPVFAEIEGEAQAVGRAALAEAGRQAEDALQAWLDLEAALDRVAGGASPSLRRVSDLLHKILKISLRYAPPPELPIEPVARDEPAMPAQETQLVARSAAGEADREALLREISRIAALFRQREPNSPLSFTLDNAVRRARLDWPELFTRNAARDGAAGRRPYRSRHCAAG